jgi:hypothetical protein
LSAVLALLAGVRRHRPDSPRPWYLFAAGQLSFLVADLIFYIAQDVLHVESPFPSIADAFYLGMYPLVIAGLVLLIRHLARGRDRDSLLDAAIITTGMFVLSWVFVMDSYAVDPGLSLLERVISLAYPIGDVLLLAVAARLAVAVHTRAPAFLLLCASITGLLVADTLYGITQLAGVYETGSFIDIGWMTFYVLFGAAALHPSIASLSRPATSGSARLTLRRLLLLSLATLTVPLIDLFYGKNQLVDEVVTTLGAMTLFLLVL